VHASRLHEGEATGERTSAFYSGVTYAAVMPPSTISDAPVMKEESSEARNSAAFASSSARPSLPMGMWTKRVATDPRPGVLDGDLSRHREHGTLRARVGRLGCGRAHPCDERCDVDDGTAAGVEHRRHPVLTAERDALHVDVERPVPHLLGRIGHRAVVGEHHAGVVVEDVQPTEAVDGEPHHPLRVGGLRHVGVDVGGASALL
jgi:hypothetical protein